jgi:hypothetical protein
MASTEKASQTSGIFGLSAVPRCFSPVTTTAPRHRASAITTGSAPDRFFAGVDQPRELGEDFTQELLLWEVHVAKRYAGFATPWQQCVVLFLELISNDNRRDRTTVLGN